MPKKPTPAPAPAAAKSDPLELVRKHPAGVAVAGGAVLGLVVLMRSRKKPTDPSGSPVSTADTTGADLVNTIQPEIDALARQIGNMADKQPTTNGLVPPLAGSGSVLLVGGSAPGVYGPGQIVPKDAAAVCQGTTCFTPKDFDALGKYMDSLPGGHG